MAKGKTLSHDLEQVLKFWKNDNAWDELSTRGKVLRVILGMLVGLAIGGIIYATGGAAAPALAGAASKITGAQFLGFLLGSSTIGFPALIQFIRTGFSKKINGKEKENATNTDYAIHAAKLIGLGTLALPMLLLWVPYVGGSAMITGLGNAVAAIGGSSLVGAKIFAGIGILAGIQAAGIAFATGLRRLAKGLKSEILDLAGRILTLAIPVALVSGVSQGAAIAGKAFTTATSTTWGMAATFAGAVATAGTVVITALVSLYKRIKGDTADSSDKTGDLNFEDAVMVGNNPGDPMTLGLRTPGAGGPVKATPVSTTTGSGSAETVTATIQAAPKPEPKSESEEPMTPESATEMLLTADNVEDITKALSLGADVNAQTGHDGTTLLHRAITNKNHKIFKFLVTVQGIDLNAKTTSDKPTTPLLLAALNDNSNLTYTKTLLEHGANPLEVIFDGQTAMQRLQSITIGTLYKSCINPTIQCLAEAEAEARRQAAHEAKDTPPPSHQ